MRIDYEKELTAVKDAILLMTTGVEKMVSDSVHALKTKDVTLAEDVIRRDDLIDHQEIELTMMVGEIIARQSPVATDLRRLASSYKIVTNLERIADLSVNIAKKVLELYNETYMKELVDIPKACDQAQELLKICIQAYINNDITQIKKVIDLEDDIDDLNHKIQTECLAYMMKDRNNVKQGSNFIFVGSYLERIGDHATNIFETVFYISTGKMIDFNDLDEEIVKGALNIQ
ncbi:phosphate signaling complex protein PhoU [Eubacteriaceae bacterium ES2]|nr:phosphate signaling complex protein PhoU [Eubacteriaceae bacterium ES2]